MSFTGTPLGQGRRVDQRTFLNKNPPLQRVSVPPQHIVSDASTSAAPAQKPVSRDQARASANQPPSSATTTTGATGSLRPERWQVKDTSVNIAAAFHSANAMPTMQQTSGNNQQAGGSMPNIPAHDRNSVWAAAPVQSTVPRSASQEYENQSLQARKRALPIRAPGRAGPPPVRRPVRADSSQIIPDSQGEETPRAYQRGTSPLDTALNVANTIGSAVARGVESVTYVMRQREPVRANASMSSVHAKDQDSYDYAQEEAEVQAESQGQAQNGNGQKPSSSAGQHRRGRMSEDNKAYQPSDEDDSDDEILGDERRRKKKGKKKEALGGPLNSLPQMTYGKARRRGRKSGSGLVDDGEATESSEDERVEQRSARGSAASMRSAGTSRTAPPLSRGPSRTNAIPTATNSYNSSGAVGNESINVDNLDSDILDSIEEEPEEPAPSAQQQKQTGSTADIPDIHGPTAPQSPDSSMESNLPKEPFSIGGFLGRIVNLFWRFITLSIQTIIRVCAISTMAVGNVFGKGFDLVTQTGAWFRYFTIGLALCGAWWLLNEPLARYMPTRGNQPVYTAPSAPPADVTELTSRLTVLERALSGLSLENVHERERADHERRVREELQDRIALLDVKLREQALRANAAEEKARLAEAAQQKAIRTEREDNVELRREIETLRATVGNIPRQPSSGTSATDQEARTRLRDLEGRIGGIEGEAREALELGKSAAKVNEERAKEKDKVSSGPAWWSKPDAKTGAITIKSADGKDITPLLSRLVDLAVARFAKDGLGRADFALHSGGASVVPSLTSDTYEIRPGTLRGQVVGLITGHGYAVGRPPVTALHHETHVGHCWPFAGTHGQLGVKLAAPTYVDSVTVDHVAREVAFDMRTAPKEMELWGLVEGADNVAKAKEYLAARAATADAATADGEDEDASENDMQQPATLPGALYLRIARFNYDIDSEDNTQTFPVSEDVRALGIDFGIVALRILSNWGQDEFTCVYRVRVHGERRTPSLPESNTTDATLEEVEASS